MTRRAVFLSVGGFVGLIGIVLLVAPGSYFQLYATDYSTGMDLPARRFAPAVLALGALLISASAVEPGPFLERLCLISAGAFLGVAITGIHAWSTGIARPAILGAAAVELVVAIVFVWLWARSRSD
ncbi:hypothetical protein [Marivita sp. XM-24bin2]|jgi:hypothetical protein|uniref:hypothetical protein n=1 Tax=unclassified Marivita TaxID=2632480 RepID=UPI000D7AAC76|nr:hypothetical protein [Marivita sp. XM-24bin2]MCR9111457.1 hypothetical protein [Paracoccaceae bacterium]PWL35270.1 MAG: hypothetical protein DCO97_10405 [Marivita sp. XM-24bin2]